MARTVDVAAGVLTDLLFEEPGVARCLVAPDGRVVRANPEWLRANGVALDDVLGADLLDLFSGVRDLWLALGARVRAGERVELPPQARRIDAREAWWEGSVAPVPMEGGTGLLVTERERAGPLARFPEENPDPVLRLGADMTIGYANDAARRRLRALCVDAGAPAPPDLARAGREALAAGRPVAAELTCADAVFSMTVVPVGGDVNVYATDITAGKRGEEALRRSEEQLRASTLGADVGVWSWIPRTGDVTVTANWRRLFGVAGDAEVTYETWRDALHPDDRERVARELVEATAEHRDFDTEYRVLRGDGSIRWIVDRGRAAYDAEGRAVSMSGVNVDITDRKRAEEDLAIVTRLYAVLSRVNEAIVRRHDEASLYEEVCRIVAEEGGFPLVWVGLVRPPAIVPVASWGSATAYLRDLRVEVDGVLGQGPTGTCVREDRTVINDDFDVNPRTLPWRERIRAYNLRASAAFPLHRGGEVIGALTFYAPRPGAFTAQQVKLLEALCADVSYALDAIEQERLRTDAERALRESEHALREADRHKNEFLGMLSHELRNPLAPIRNSVYILQNADPAGDGAERARGVIERQVEHLTRLVDDLLDVTRIARGKIELRRSRLDLREVVLRAADDFRVLMEERGVAFHATLPAAGLWADADATRLTQIIGNLLQNAAKFARRGDAVTLSLRAADLDAEISVQDTGPGIDASLLPNVFEPFVQGSRTLARTEGGLGLGLALVKGITELHGGSVHAASAGPGRGAEFIVRLPLAPAADVEVRRIRPRVCRGDGGRRVLVVDDNRDSAQSMAEIVRLLGHAAEVAYDGPSAIEMVEASHPDVVLCDIGLPGMSGYDVAKALRERGGPPLQLVAVTGYAQAEDLEAAAEAGFDRHMPKPVSIEEIERLLA